MSTFPYISVAVLVLYSCTLVSCFNPVSGISAVAAGIGSFIYTGYEAIICRVASCCDSRWIIGNISGLESDLAQKLHGQHLVQRTVVGHIKGHMRNSNPSKALALSFHGLTGVGKNHVSRIIAENLYKKGLHSEYVHLIAATKEFPHEGMIHLYKDQLKSWIEGNVSRCERSLFIFDEIDKFPGTLLDVIKPYLDYYEHLGGIIYRKAIFLFLSNSGGSDVGLFMFDHWKSGKPRESLELSAVERLIMRAAINVDSHNGLWHSSLISSQLITAYIPFLPLEKVHVKKCIKDLLVTNKYYRHIKDIPEAIVDEVVKELTFIPPTEQVFSSTGCKRVAEKIDYVMVDKTPNKHFQHTEF